MKRNGNTQRILDLLAEIGPMTRSEIEDAMGYERATLGKLITGLMRENKTHKKRIHITSWAYDHEGGQTYPRAVYKIGNGTDKPKPVRDMNKRCREYRARKKAKAVNGSIFWIAENIKWKKAA